MTDCDDGMGRREFLRLGTGGALAVLAGTAPALAAVPSSSLRPVDAAFFGLHMVWPVRAPYIQNAPSVPYGAWRALVPETHWFSLEPKKNEWRFDKLDLAMRLMESQGVDVLLTLCGTPTWASSKPDLRGVYTPGEDAPPKSLADWESYVRTVAERYRGRIRHYELWNEPAVREVDGDKAHFTARQLVELGQAAYRIIKEVDPSARLTTPAMVGGEKGIARMDAYLAAGGSTCTDIVSFHFYGLPEQIPQYHAALVNMLRRHGLAHLPIWNTEFGYLIEDPTTPNTHPLIGGAFARVLPADEAAARLARSLIIAASLGIERFYWFMWDGRNMGLISYQEKTINAAGRAFGRVANWLTNRTVSTIQRIGNVAFCQLAEDGRTVGHLVWPHDYRTQPWVAPQSWKVTSVVGLDGDSESLSRGQAVMLAAGPVLLPFSSQAG